MERFPDCVDCGEPDSGSCPEDRCRQCDIDHWTSVGACRECLVWITCEEWGGPIPEQHDHGCSLAHAENYTARDAAELARVRKSRTGWAP